MTTKTPHGTFELTPLTFKDRRQLHSLEIAAISQDGKLDNSKFYLVLDWVMNFAFINPEKELQKYDDNAVDEILMAIYNQYKEPSKKKK